MSMHGVVNGIYYCNIKRSNELNERIASRNVPSAGLEPQFSMRPIASKYEMMPIFDRRAPVNEPIIKKPTYNIKEVFNPGNSTAPWCGFAASVNDESKLRNQYFALQKGGQGVYIPSSESDLYNDEIPKHDNVKQPYPNLFKKEHLAPFNPNCLELGGNLFNNYTRVQLKQMGDNK
jgi:hypothetical protein